MAIRHRTPYTLERGEALVEPVSFTISLLFNGPLDWTNRALPTTSVAEQHHSLTSLHVLSESSKLSLETDTLSSKDYIQQNNAFN